jgi:hypothetical protein
VTKIRESEEGKEGMLVQIHLPQIKTGVIPRKRFMSAWEQKREPPNRAYQYLIVRYRSAIALEKYSPLVRWPLSPMKRSHSEFLQKKSRRMTKSKTDGIGHIGTPTQSSSVFNSCFEERFDYIGSNDYM